jgi:small subunit ribosomal protein S15
MGKFNRWSQNGARTTARHPSIKVLMGCESPFSAQDLGEFPYLCPQNKQIQSHLIRVFKKSAMSVTKEKKASIFKNFAGSETNTGSIEGQIALITERMAQISNHLQENKKDFSTHRGLMQLVGRRRRLLNYLQKHNLQSYRSLIEKLGIRK